ncbi:RNA polymerase sigma factor [Streptomyces daliensis]|uniref:Sigma-70 family RNA polymerase sigma factor n=1 Tax=Streptomyces daliensis TaxID=299421 RepID=A0A8T4J0A2_9ACTN|nr:sigma-70 family RNA polymerase sigma factor [Streptomyces daliensis]
MRTATYPVVPAFPATGALRRGWERLLRGLLARTGQPPPGVRQPVVPVPTAPLSTPGEPHPAIDDLYHHRRLDLVRLALFLVDDLPTAEDVVQDAFAALFRRHGAQMRGVDDPEAYLRTSVVNRSRSVLRRRRTARAHIPEREGHVPPVDEHVLLREEHREVLEALRRLTRRQREVLVLRYWSHLTEAQIATTLDLSRGAVKSTASRALDALSRQLGGSR